MSLLYDLVRWGYCLYKSKTEWKTEANAQTRFSREVYCILRGGGWFPGRAVPVPDSIKWHQPAAAIAAEFGDLTFAGPWGEDQMGPDLRCTSVSIEREPYINEEMRRFGLCEIGTICSEARMFVDLDGLVYGDGMSYSAASRLEPLGRSIDRALECLLLGIRPRHADVSDHQQIDLTM